MVDYPRRQGEGFDIIDQSGFSPEPFLGGIGRPQSRHGSFALEGGQEGGFFSADKGAGALHNVEIETEVAVENMVAQEISLQSVVESLAHALNG